MRSFHQFTPGEWATLLPLRQGLRQWRNDLLLARYRQAVSPGLDEFLTRNAHLRDGNIVIVIAFEQPWALDWLLKQAAQHVVGATLLVFDNSRTEEARRGIREVCERRGAPYLGLPDYRTRHANRSHGMAMSWIHENVVQRLQPRTFGFIDHDLVPVQRIDFAGRLGDQPAYGMLNAGNFGHWNLWAGYCMYRQADTARLPLNFLYDFSRGLDTGGRNWNPLYRGLDRAKMRFAPQEFIELRLDADTAARVEVVDGCWVHMGGIGYDTNFRDKIGFFSRLREELERGVGWDELRRG